MQVPVSMPSSVLVHSILGPDKTLQMDMGLFHDIFLPGQCLIYKLLPLDMKAIHVLVRDHPIETSSVSNTRVDPPAEGSIEVTVWTYADLHCIIS